MRRAVVPFHLCSSPPSVWDPIHGQITQPPLAGEIERQFDALINPAEMGGWMKIMAAEPNHVGSPHNKANAEMVLAQFQSLGLGRAYRNLRGAVSDADQRNSGACRGRTVQGDADRSADTWRPDLHKEALPAYVAFQGDGDVTAPLVYVNYGMPEDYMTLERWRSVKGKIVIARYGGGWRGLKPKLAQKHGPWAA